MRHTFSSIPILTVKKNEKVGTNEWKTQRALAARQWSDVGFNVQMIWKWGGQRGLSASSIASEPDCLYTSSFTPS